MVLLPRTSVHRAVCPTCSVCLLQFTLGQCRPGQLTPSTRPQRVPEVLLQPGSTRVELTLLFENDAWPTTRPNSSRKRRLHRFRLLWLVPALRVALNTTRWLIRAQAAPVTHPVMEKLPVLGHPIKGASTDSLLAQSSAYYPGEGIPRVSAQFVLRYDETSDDDNYSPGFTISLTWQHTNLI